MRIYDAKYSEYYERTFSRPEIENALALYLKWIAGSRDLNPEARVLSDIYDVDGPSMLDHVLYHAEIQQQKEQGGRVNYTDQLVINKVA